MTEIGVRMQGLRAEQHYDNVCGEPVGGWVGVQMQELWCAIQQARFHRKVGVQSW